MIKVSEVRLGLDEDLAALKHRAAKKAKVSEKNLKYFRVIKKSIDARDKGDVHFSCSVEMDYCAPKPANKPQEVFSYPKNPVVIVGFGPAGMFAALELARAGFCPIVLERGLSAAERKKKIDLFNSSRVLDEECNVQFGEGGAGTFSDGKLNTGVGGERKREILEDMVLFGAPSEILVDAKPHVGSDKLPTVVTNLRKQVENLGGKVLFSAKLVEITAKNGKIESIKAKINGKIEEIEVSDVVLAIGHSSRDTFEYLHSAGVLMEQKDMAVGFRIEHLQKDVDKSQYGAFAGHKSLGAADYKLTSQAAGRGVFTFCMCPGGYVVAATSEQNAVVTNGMSDFLRDGENANSAVVAQVKASEYGGSGALCGIDFQRRIEQAAFKAGGGDYSAPMTTLKAFFAGQKPQSFGRVKPTYPLGGRLVSFDNILPANLTEAIKTGIKDMGRRLKGFDDDDAILTAAETRTSSPVRVVRGQNLASVSHENLYPTGEVGYAGGIMSSALDGLKIAEKIKEKYKR